jgi:uncharacterized membrane protein YbaN (DUF454 family)
MTNFAIISEASVLSKDVMLFKSHMKEQDFSKLDTWCYIKVGKRFYHCYINHKYYYLLIKKVEKIKPRDT